MGGSGCVSGGGGDLRVCGGVFVTVSRSLI